MVGIGEVVKHLLNGGMARRTGWNGPNQFLFLFKPELHSNITVPFVAIHTEQGNGVPWLCSATDLLATDWELR